MISVRVCAPLFRAVTSHCHLVVSVPLMSWTGSSGIERIEKASESWAINSAFIRGVILMLPELTVPGSVTWLPSCSLGTDGFSNSSIVAVSSSFMLSGELYAKLDFIDWLSDWSICDSCSWMVNGALVGPATGLFVGRTSVLLLFVAVGASIVLLVGMIGDKMMGVSNIDLVFVAGGRLDGMTAVTMMAVGDGRLVAVGAGGLVGAGALVGAGTLVSAGALVAGGALVTAGALVTVADGPQADSRLKSTRTDAINDFFSINSLLFQDYRVLRNGLSGIIFFYPVNNNNYFKD